MFCIVVGTPTPGTLGVAPGSTISFTTKLCSCVTPGEGLYNNICHECTVGKAAATLSSRCKSCTAGRYQEQAIATSYGCKTCSAGQHSVDKEQPCTNCATGQSQTLSVATAYTCNECAKGQYASSASVACTNCAAGQYQAQTVATTHACKTCGVGQYSLDRETNGCSNCVPGVRVPVSCIVSLMCVVICDCVCNLCCQWLTFCCCFITFIHSFNRNIKNWLKQRNTVVKSVQQEDMNLVLPRVNVPVVLSAKI